MDSLAGERMDDSESEGQQVVAAVTNRRLQAPLPNSRDSQRQHLDIESRGS